MHKIKLLAIAFFSVFCLARSHAQVTVVDSLFNADTVFSQLDVGLITSGILIDRLGSESSIGLYNGSCNDCFTNDVSFRQVMLNLQMCRFANNAYLLGYDSIYQEHMQQNKAVPIQIVNILYNKIRDSAFSNNLLVLNNGLLDEGANTSQSPYDSYRFLACHVADNMVLLDKECVLRNEDLTQ